MSLNTGEDKRDSLCYSDADLLLKLHGTEINHEGELNSATAIHTFLSGYPAAIHSSCLSQPEQCKHGALTLSFWMRIDNLTDGSATSVLPHPLENLESTLLMTGKTKETGITVDLFASSKSGAIQIDMNISLATGNQLWMINAKNSTQLGRWTNVGLHWSQRTHNRPGILEVYLDGHRKHTTSVPLEKTRRSGLSEDSRKLDIKKTIYSMPSAQQETGNIFVNGAISNIAFWESSAVSCSMPRSAKQRLLGMCSLDPRLVEPVPCAEWHNCAVADGSPYLYHLGIGAVSLQGTFLAITLGVINKQLLAYCFTALHRKNE
ncbi:hypothetical protein EG68_07245 [Paragonimus skrjabini miyazakii]|uniref:Uncharacterized protein n=1 Tax=Paragonimus skrjabini miyazakii TaxID=59628 RepID=A0A8S9YKF9_9TREM|nr:hypothetical protein EG68_07245 [Paragonimus skrjabini miyazakii]